MLLLGSVLQRCVYILQVLPVSVPAAFFLMSAYDTSWFNLSIYCSPRPFVPCNMQLVFYRTLSTFSFLSAAVIVNWIIKARWIWMRRLLELWNFTFDINDLLDVLFISILLVKCSTCENRLAGWFSFFAISFEPRTGCSGPCIPHSILLVDLFYIHVSSHMSLLLPGKTTKWKLHGGPSNADQSSIRLLMKLTNWIDCSWSKLIGGHLDVVMGIIDLPCSSSYSRLPPIQAERNEGWESQTTEYLSSLLSLSLSARDSPSEHAIAEMKVCKYGADTTKINDFTYIDSLILRIDCLTQYQECDGIVVITHLH